MSFMVAFGNDLGCRVAYTYDRRIARRFVRRYGGDFVVEGRDRSRGRLYEWSVTKQHPAPSVIRLPFPEASA